MRLIQKMKPQTVVKKKKKKKKKGDSEEWESKADKDLELKKIQFPGLAMANDYAVRVSRKTEIQWLAYVMVT